MVGYTFAEKAIARAAGLSHVRAGEIVDVTPDLVFSHDNSAAIRTIFETIGAKRIRYPERVAITLDHAVPAPTTRHADNHASIREWVKQQNIRHFFEVGRGICHQVLSEEKLILPGEMILGADSHSTHFGWLGAFGAGVGRTEMAALWATGSLWMRVPETIQITLRGKLPKGCTAKDISLAIIGRYGVDGGTYYSIEFTGDTIEALSLDERAVLPNMMAEFGAKNAYIPPDERIFEFLGKTARPYTPLYPDSDAVYAHRYSIDVDHLSPQIALPDSPDNVVPLTEVVGTPIQQAFIGTCTNGRLEDIAAAATLLRGRHVKTRLLVIPASAEVYKQAIRCGYIETLLEAGAVIGTSGCGPCMGNHMGVPAQQESTISTGNRNFKGRMGTPNAPIYLANPYVVAASAIHGVISDPREFL
ncbi:MAG: 3-isopropylmalate dehydratase large subunit [Phototrophicales bacterium]|nr:MAG: 3-isopropylmalate dehydratase large subunit [Phototrophicales bacterium]